LLLGVGFGHDLHHPVALDHGESLQSQRREQRGVDEAFRHRPRRDDVDAALDPGIDQEIAAGDLGDRLDDRLDVRVDEIERDGIVRSGRDRRETGPYRKSKRDDGMRAAAGQARFGEWMAPVYAVSWSNGRQEERRGCARGPGAENCTNRSAPPNFAATAPFQE
jgi:hypothetical protein